MRGLILGVLLALAPLLVWAGDARMLFMAATLQGASYVSYTFEDGTAQGWSAGAYSSSASDPHTGTYCLSGSAGYTSRTITTADGTLSFWYRSDGTSGALKADGVTILSLPSNGQVWEYQSVSITGATDSVIRFEVAGGAMALDDISIPIP